MRLRNAVAVLVTFSSVGFAAPASSDELAEVRAPVYRSDLALTAPSRSSASAVAAGFLRSRGGFRGDRRLSLVPRAMRLVPAREPFGPARFMRRTPR
jgi:hypothetical protein